MDRNEQARSIVNVLESICLRDQSAVNNVVCSLCGDSKYFDNQRGTATFDPSQRSLIIYTDPSYECLQILFEAILAKGDYINLKSIREVIIDHYDFERLPANFATVFSRCETINFEFCPNFRYLNSIVSQNFEAEPGYRIICQDCPSLDSLNSLSTILPHSKLCGMSFKRCGLKVTREDDWREGLAALGRLQNTSGIPGLEAIPRKMNLSIKNCTKLRSLPSSISLLKKLSLRITLKQCDLIKRLPSSISELNLEKLNCSNSVNITLNSLPSLMSRLNPKCTITLHKEGRFRIMDLNGFFRESRRRFFRGLIMAIVLMKRCINRYRKHIEEDQSFFMSLKRPLDALSLEDQDESYLLSKRRIP